MMCVGPTHHLIRRLFLCVLLCLWHGGRAVAEPVRIAYAEVFPPFTELKDGKAEGLAVDIVRAAAGRARIEVEFVAVPFEQVQWRMDAPKPYSPLQSLLNVFRYSISAPLSWLRAARSSYERRIVHLKDWAPSQARSWSHHEPVLSPLISRRMRRT